MVDDDDGEREREIEENPPPPPPPRHLTTEERAERAVERASAAERAHVVTVEEGLPLVHGCPFHDSSEDVGRIIFIPHTALRYR